MEAMTTEADEQCAALRQLEAAQDARLAQLKAGTIPPDSPAVKALKLRERGNMLYNAGEWEAALTANEDSMAIEPSATIFANLALVLLDLDRMESAEAACLNALVLQPEYPKVQWRLTHTWCRMGRASAALEVLQKLLDSPHTAQDPQLLKAVLDKMAASESFISMQTTMPLLVPRPMQEQRAMQAQAPTPYRCLPQCMRR